MVYAVIDTNIFVSALITHNSNASQKNRRGGTGGAKAPLTKYMWVILLDKADIIPRICIYFIFL